MIAQSLSKKLNRGITSGGPRFQNLSKNSQIKGPPFHAVSVPSMCVEGAVCMGTNLDDEQTPSTTMSGFCTQSLSSTTSFWAQNTAKSVLRRPFLHTFSSSTFLCYV